MLRLTDLKLPLDHPDGAIETALCARLGLRREELRSLRIARRAWDARKRSGILLVYTLDFEAADEPALLRRAARDGFLARSSARRGTAYRHAARAPEAGWRRPSSSAPAPAACSPR